MGGSANSFHSFGGGGGGGGGAWKFVYAFEAPTAIVKISLLPISLVHHTPFLCHL